MEKLLACPFCGQSNDNLEVVELFYMPESKFDKNGRLHKRCELSHCVSCYNCGAKGPSSTLDLTSKNITTIDGVIYAESEALAVLNWNSRGEVNLKAIEYVNQLINRAHTISTTDDIKSLSVKDVADSLDTHEATIWRIIKSGKLPAFRVGSALRVKVKDLELFMKNNAVEPVSGKVW